ncbi:hypothetical protein BU14_0207s0016 [Porphyra umbilicalis]|uniref:Uncharacterized protein n=1 Tax=Porphyra umbilicalis TaxID=2786 RepID=A0A1X6P5I9_PORUM|nr:hypothetical protein BU14_0207s0016 [Porphyra umbilicalis]|eukprot:OSX76097.1 hypothetical protein BU14_0207s0016 [Porphyra umbilicalis]
MAPSATWSVANLEPQGGKTVIVTGGNSGVGYESALHLALKGATVIIACRSMERGDAAAARIRAALAAPGVAAGGSVEVLRIDTSDLASVRAFVAAFSEKHTALHVLLNNAGVAALPRTLSADGQELQLATNHLGHFALTGLLLPLLAATPGARVVNVSSPAHGRAKGLAYDDWMLEGAYSPFGAYARSKLANLLFTRELARRLEKANTPVMAVAANPGWAVTELANKAAPSILISIAVNVFQPLLSHSAEAGACPLLYAATESDVTADDYWSPQWLDLKGFPGRGKKSALATNDAEAAELWAKSEDVTGVKYLD